MEELLSRAMGATDLTWSATLLRLLVAPGLCAVIGFERERKQRPAGLRTHMLIGLAACVYCLLTLDLTARFADSGDHVKLDPLRMVEAITSGVAFLAAGTIIFTRGEVQGLTTGASMWLAASVGLAVGLGLFGIAVVTTVLALAIMGLLQYSVRGADDP